MSGGLSVACAGQYLVPAVRHLHDAYSVPSAYSDYRKALRSLTFAIRPVVACRSRLGRVVGHEVQIKLRIRHRDLVDDFETQEFVELD